MSKQMRLAGTGVGRVLMADIRTKEGAGRMKVGADEKGLVQEHGIMLASNPPNLYMLYQRAAY